MALAAVSLADHSSGRDGADEGDIATLSLYPTNERPANPPGKGNRGKGGPGKRHINEPWVRFFVGGGRRVGMRPADLVGAITNEAERDRSVNRCDPDRRQLFPGGGAGIRRRRHRPRAGSAKIKGKRLEVRRYRER